MRDDDDPLGGIWVVVAVVGVRDGAGVVSYCGSWL